MSRNGQQILEAFKQLVEPGMISFPATVRENYPDLDHVEVEDMLGTIYPEVRKRAAIDGKKGILITPVKGSSVIVTKLSGNDSNSLVISLFSEVESINVTLENHTVKMDKSGLVMDFSTGKVELKNNLSSLVKLCDTLTDIISKITVSTPNGPSGTPLPPTITALEKFKTDYKNLLR